MPMVPPHPRSPALAMLLGAILYKNSVYTVVVMVIVVAVSVEVVLIATMEIIMRRNYGEI